MSKTYKIKIDSNFNQVKNDINYIKRVTLDIKRQFENISRTRTPTIKPRIVTDRLTSRLLSKEFDDKVMKLTMKVVGTSSIKSVDLAVKAATKTVSLLGKSVVRTTEYFKNFTAQLRITENGINFLVRNQGIIGTALSYGTVEAIDEFIKVEHQLNRVRAVAGENRASYEHLKNAVLDLAQASSLTARELGKGAEMFALAGFKTKEITQILPELTSLVINSGEAMSRIADVTASSIRTWDTDLRHLNATADRLTSGMANAKTTIGELGMGMSYAAPMFKATQQGVSALVAALQVMADRGITAQKSGVGLRAMMVKLAKPTAEAKQALDELNVSIVRGVNMQSEMQTMLDTVDDEISYSAELIADLNNAYKNKISLTEYKNSLEEIGIAIHTNSGKLKSYQEILHRVKSRAEVFADAQRLANSSLQSTGRLSGPALTALGKLGVKIDETQGRFRDINALFAEFNKKFSTLTDTERLARAKELVGLHHAEKFIQLVDGAREMRKEMNILGESVNIVATEMQIQTLRNDLATKSGQKFALVYKALGGRLEDLAPALNVFTTSLDNHSKSILNANGDVTMFLQSMVAFRGAGLSWADTIDLATNTSKNFNTMANSLTQSLVALGSSVSFDSTFDGLLELRRLIELQGEQKVMDTLVSTIGEDLAAAYVKAASNTQEFTDHAKAELDSVVGKSTEMRGEIEKSTQHLLDRLISAWQATGFKIGESLEPLVARLFEIGIVAAQVMGDMLPPLLENLLGWLSRFEISTESVRDAFRVFFEYLEAGFKKIGDFFTMFATLATNNGLTIENVLKVIGASFKVLLEVIMGFGKALSWLGLVNDETLQQMESAMSSLTQNWQLSNNTMTNSTKTMTTEVQSDMGRAAEQSALIALGMNDNISREMHNMGTNVSAEIQQMSMLGTSSMRSMGSSMESAAASTGQSVVNQFNNTKYSVIDTMRSMYREAINWITSLGRDITQKAKFAFDLARSYLGFGPYATQPINVPQNRPGNVQPTAGTPNNELQERQLEETVRTNQLLSEAVAANGILNPVY